VNPARCLPTCAFDPSPNLLRVNPKGEPDPRGRYQLLADVQPALVALLAAARAAGHVLRIESAFRSYDEQARLFATIKEQGRAARPGHSEHQLGSTIDLRLPSSAAIEWLAAHAADHGFALSYPPDKQRTTGYRPEPWHVRFVGRELAEELRSRGTTLEEHFRTRPGLGESGSCGDCPLPASRAACGDVTAAGSCSGTVLLWCYDGALNAVDCAVSGQQCGRPAGSDLHDCLPKPLASVPAEPPAQSLAAR
jgi:D-alanyl-D-alanine carboxypeptidase